MNRRLLFSAVLILVLASLMIFRSQMKQDVKAEGKSHDTISNGVEVDGGVTDSDRRKLSSRKLSKGTIETLRGLGYQFSADKISKRSAAGNVTLVSPKGLIFKSDHVSISSDGNFIYLEGEILVEAKSGEKTKRLKYSGDSASAKIGIDGKSMSFKGDMATWTVPSDPDR